MKKVYEAADVPDAQIIKDVLVTHGFQAQVFGADLQMALGELPIAVLAPSVWVADSDYAAAMKVLDENRKQRSKWQNKSWTCSSCREKIEGQFSKCWKCGSGYEE